MKGLSEDFCGGGADILCWFIWGMLLLLLLLFPDGEEGLVMFCYFSGSGNHRHLRFSTAYFKVFLNQIR